MVGHFRPLYVVLPPCRPLWFFPHCHSKSPPKGRFPPLWETWSKLSRNVRLSKINGVISFKQKSPTSRLKCLVCTLTKTRLAQTIRQVRPWPYLFSDSTIRFSFKEPVHTAADRSWKAQNNCSLLYTTNSPPTALVTIVHTWMLNTELETGLEIYKRRSFEAWTRSRLPIQKPHCRCLQQVGY